MRALATRVAIVGAGPAGLMAAETARAAGAEVDVYERMASVARKFLVAGKGGLNLTHADPFDAFVARYRERAAEVRPWLRAFDADGVRRWARRLGVDTFVGSSGRVFPHDLKAAPLLRAWLRRLRADGVRFHVRHDWTGWDANGALRFRYDQDDVAIRADAVVLALGGASWPVLGADGAWVRTLTERGVAVAPLMPANCGFDVAWSAHFAERFAGAPVKPVIAAWHDAHGTTRRQQGEFVVTATGVEGSLIYALSADLRDAIAAAGTATIELDLVPGRDTDALAAVLGKPRGRRSFGEHLRRVARIDGVKAGLLYEASPTAARGDASRTAALMKRLPLRFLRARPIDEAISSAGGVRFDALDAGLMMSRLPGVFAAGEMIDWEAPTGGYLLTACLASGHVAGAAAARWRSTQ